MQYNRKSDTSSNLDIRRRTVDYIRQYKEILIIISDIYSHVPLFHLFYHYSKLYLIVLQSFFFSEAT